ncbi:MAG: DUF1080 domain-containing protein [Acidobacteria bacterium]|jgi:hypothetical protein|nr:DUF1080 domain-containing protein [Acidobacteriota bacterium]
MRTYAWSVVLILALGALPTRSPAADAAKSIPLFNGKDLSGWSYFLVDPDVAMEDVWSVQDGLLVCKGEPLGYLYTTAEYTSYELVVEWRWAPGTEPGNSGVLMRINGEPRAIPRSYEAQLQSGNAGALHGFWGMKLSGDPARKREITDHERLGDMVAFAKIEANENPPGEWNRYDIRLAGPDIVLRVNGKTLNEATDTEVLAGPIGLQSEGGEIQFRKVELTPLD